MITSREDIVTRFRSLIGDNDSEDVTKFIEDVSDTIGEGGWQQKYNDLQQQYNDNDKAWRDKYRARFEQPIDLPPDPNPDPEDTPKKYTFESLFKEG